MSGPVAQHQQAPAEEHMPAPAPVEAEGASRLPRELELNLETLEAGDAKLLAMILRSHPQLQDAIIERVSGMLGNAIVNDAMAILAEPAPAKQAPAAAEAPPAGGLTHQQELILLSVETLETGESEQLAKLIRHNPDLREQIIARATAAVGEATVQAAIAILDGQPPAAQSSPEAAPLPPPAPEAAPAPAAQPAPAEFDYLTSPLALEYGFDEKVHDHVDYIRAHPALRETILAQAAVHDAKLAAAVRQALDAPQPAATTETTPPQVVAETAQAATETQTGAGTAPKPEAESGWVVRAREYNAAHGDLVTEFNILTGFSCMSTGPNDELALDPNLVATWQQDHGIAPDGRIGEHTLKIARAMQRPGNAQPLPEEYVEEVKSEE